MVLLNFLGLEEGINMHKLKAIRWKIVCPTTVSVLSSLYSVLFIIDVDNSQLCVSWSISVIKIYSRSSEKNKTVPKLTHYLSNSINLWIQKKKKKEQWWSNTDWFHFFIYLYYKFDPCFRIVVNVEIYLNSCLVNTSFIL